MCVALDMLPNYHRTHGTIATARTRPNTRDPDGLGYDASLCQFGPVVELWVGSRSLVVRTRPQRLTYCPMQFRPIFPGSTTPHRNQIRALIDRPSRPRCPPPAHWRQHRPFRPTNVRKQNSLNHTRGPKPCGRNALSTRTTQSTRLRGARRLSNPICHTQPVRKIDLFQSAIGQT